MLVLTRKPRESIILDGQTRIKVIEIKGNSIKLGIEAPPNVSIVREELAPGWNTPRRAEVVAG